ncbi:hypothetical protein SIN8267_00631 [Sinobacterium norvegicum]|uniref:Uncharacterized protein n=1 Tax=Sinobacterium norvegicum TaxID=1641715 RepID=A0ABN8EDL8_9GAMM|nr:hypothetical protein [Sinobacterium norvegicum]CAH0990539.1 hypothetical protein SIN8267_00631 [Sinobacterium norvegicum]
MIRLSKTLFKALDFASFKAECKIADNIQVQAVKRSERDGIQWLFDSAFIDKKADKVSAIYVNVDAPDDDAFNLTYSAKSSDQWRLVEFCSLDE